MDGNKKEKNERYLKRLKINISARNRTNEMAILPILMWPDVWCDVFMRSGMANVNRNLILVLFCTIHLVLKSTRELLFSLITITFLLIDSRNASISSAEAEIPQHFRYQISLSNEKSILKQISYEKAIVYECWEQKGSYRLSLKTYSTQHCAPEEEKDEQKTLLWEFHFTTIFHKQPSLLQIHIFVYFFL